MAKILIIDDRPLNRQFLTTLLGYQKHQLSEASDGAEGLRVARAQRPDLVISDVLMPTMDGYEFVHRLREDPDIGKTPVVFSTAHYLSHESQALAEKCGVTSIIYKPCEPQTVLDIIEAALQDKTPRAQLTAQPEEFSREHIQVLTDQLSYKAEQLRDANGKLTALIDLSTELSKERDPVKLLDRYCSVVREVIGARWTLVALLERDRKTVQHLKAVGLEFDDTPELRAALMQSGVIATVMKEDRAICLSDVTSRPGALQLPDGLPRSDSLLVTPLSLRGETYGWICLGGKLGLDAFSEQDERLAATLAAKMAVAYDNAQLFSDATKYASQLLESKARLAGIIDSAMDAIITIDSSQRVIMFNPAAEKMFHWSASQAIGQSLDHFIPERFRSSHARDIRNYGEQGVTTRSMGGARVVNGRRSDGEEFPLEASISQIEVEGQKFYTAILRDVTQRKLDEEARQASELRYRRLFESSKDGILILDANTGEIIDANPCILETLGYSYEELVGKELWELGVFKDIAAARDSFEELRDQGYVRYQDLPLETLKGTLIEFEFVSNVYLVGGSRVMQCNIRDITERKFAEEEKIRLSVQIESQGQRLDNILTSVPGVVWEAWGEPDAATQRINFVSDYVETLLGYTVDEWLATPNFWLSIVHPDDREEAARVAGESFASGKTSPQVFRWMTKAGRAVWVESNYAVIRDDDGRPVGLRGVTINVDERQRAAEAVSQAEKKYRSIFDNAIEGIFQSTVDGKFISVNPAMAHILGYDSPEEVITAQINLSTQHYVDPTRRAELAKMLTEQDVVAGFECEVYRRDGSKIWTIENIRAIRDEKGVLLHYEGSIEDITERKGLEVQLQQSQKLEAIGILAGGIAHDFNNLLTVISGYSDLALMRLRPEESLHKNISEVVKAAARAASLTRQLLAFSRKQVLQPRVLDLNAVVSEVEKMLRRLIGEDIELRTILGRELGSVKADPGQIEQVLMNLAVNARDAMPQGGKLTIETENIFLDEDYAGKHVAIKSGAHVMLAVTDTGTGMDEKTRERLFEPFFTTKRLGKGTGLGLSMVYGIVKQSGGNIWVYSEVGRGTTFKVYLPRVDEGAPEYKRGLEVQEAARGTETILLAEDEEMVRRLAREVLEAFGYKVLEAANGGSALLICERNEGVIDLLVTDVVMPEMSGRELADRLSRFHPNMKMLYMSGYTDNSIVHQGVLDRGANFIQKPFPPSALALKIRKVLDKQN
jgi:two-component system cell cycle sensor histidine kinase/response regulator CckA